MANVDLATYRIRIGLFRGGCRTKEKGTSISVSQLSDYSTRLSLAILTVVFALLVVHGIEKNPGPGSSDQNRVNGESSVGPKESAITELENAFYETIDKFPLQQFKIFAQSKNGLVLRYREVYDITDHSLESVDEQKYAVLSLWKEKNGENGTAERIKEVVNNFIGLESRKDVIEDFEPGARFEDVFLDLPRRFLNIAEFKRFALSKNGLSLSLSDVTSIEDDTKYSSLDQMLSMLWLWKENAGDSASTTPIMGILNNYKENQHPQSDVQDERIEDIFLKIIETFHSLSEFREFARSSNGLSLNSVDVTMIEQDSKTTFDKKLSMLRLWKQNTDNLATTATIREIVKKYENVTHQTTYQAGEPVPRLPLQAEQESSNKENTSATSAETEFVANVNDNTRKDIEYDVRSVFEDLNRLEEEVHPKLTVANFKNLSGNEALGQSNAIGTDNIQISLDQLHDDLKGTHVMLLGDAGSGKTISAKKYAKMFFKKGCNVLKNTIMIFYISVSDLQHETKWTAFDLLITPLIGLPTELKKAGEGWVQKNADKILLILDGLDRAGKPFGGPYPKVHDLNMNWETNTILANILSGFLYPGMRILSTSRWSTFWKLDSKQKPSKAVVLESFNDDEIPNILSNLVVSNAREEALQNEISQSLNIVSLCKNPMFLIYMAKVLKQTDTKIPETESEIIVSVLNFFSHSEHFNADIQKLTKLAFSGIENNIFSFSAFHAEKHGLEVSDLQGIMTTKAEPEPHQLCIGKMDLNFEFLHQTMQELLAALELFNFQVERFREFVSVELNKPQWQATRKFFYGIVLNPMTSKLAEKYVRDKNISLLHCVQFLESQLKSFLSSGTITDIELVSLLHECGPNAISKIKHLIKEMKISRDTPDFAQLKPGEHYALAHVSNECLPLECFSVERINLNSNILQLMQDSSKSVDVMKIHGICVKDKTLDFELFRKSAELASTAESEYFGFVDSNLNIDKLSSFIRGASEYKLRMNQFVLFDKIMGSGAFYKFAQVASITGAEVLQFSDCNLTSEKMNAFARGVTDFGLKINRFFLSDKTMESETFHKFAQVASSTGADEVEFSDCNLTSEKLNAFAQGATDFGLKINYLHLQNETIDTEAFHKFAQVASTTKAETVHFTNCSLTSENLTAFARGATDIGLTIKQFVVSDKTMESEAFHKFAEVASTIGANAVHFGDCNLTSKKLNALAQGVTDFGLKINHFGLFDKAMESEAFHKFAQVTSTTGADVLEFGDCNLTSEKLNAFAQGAIDFGLKISCLIIAYKTMECEAFHNIAEVASITKAKIMTFADCLASKELNIFKQGAIDCDLKINSLNLFDKTMEFEAFHIFAQIASIVETSEVKFNDCNLTIEKLKAFAQGATDSNLKVRNWNIVLQTFII
uniref:uncharacterized protein LOC120336003 n=1 Tax=Styela clava TaxID=7725 RepID=UPI00193929D2|nr:uncharacterized protein LOC120336003 [Styela clava]